MPPRDWPDRTSDFVRALSGVSLRLRSADVLRAASVAVPLSAVVDVILKMAGMPAVAAGAAAAAGIRRDGGSVVESQPHALDLQRRRSRDRSRAPFESQRRDHGGGTAEAS